MSKPTRRMLLRAAGAAGGIGVLAAAGRRAQAQAGGHDIVLGTLSPGSGYTLCGDGGDTTALWEEAFAGLARSGGGAIRVRGRHLISRPLRLPSVGWLEIAGDGDALLRKAEPGREFPLLASGRPDAPFASLAVRHLRFVGDWDAVPSMGGDSARCLAVRGYHRVILQDLTAEAFRNMTFTADDCDEVVVRGCRILRSARDPINLTGSRFVKVTGCTIQNAWDDAIAVHVPRDVEDETRRYATLISGNQILQAHGIKVLGGRDVSIVANQIIAPNNYGIYLGRDPYWREGNVPHRNVVIADNLVSEMLPHDYLPGQGDVGAGIFFFDAGRRLHNVSIRGNVVTKSKPSGRGIRYSDWGFGPHAQERRLFTAAGWIDPELVHGHMGRGIGVRVIAANADDPEQVAIADNSFAGLAMNIERRIEQ